MSKDIIELSIHNSQIPRVDLDVLKTDDSGFLDLKNDDLDFSEPLGSTFETVFTTIGVVISAAQLSISLYQIIKQNRKIRISGDKKFKIIINTQIEKVDISNKTENEIKAILVKYEKDKDD